MSARSCRAWVLVHPFKTGGTSCRMAACDWADPDLFISMGTAVLSPTIEVIDPDTTPLRLWNIVSKRGTNCYVYNQSSPESSADEPVSLLERVRRPAPEHMAGAAWAAARSSRSASKRIRRVFVEYHAYVPARIDLATWRRSRLCSMECDCVLTTIMRPALDYYKSFVANSLGRVLQYAALGETRQALHKLNSGSRHERLEARRAAWELLKTSWRERPSTHARLTLWLRNSQSRELALACETSALKHKQSATGSTTIKKPTFTSSASGSDSLGGSTTSPALSVASIASQTWRSIRDGCLRIRAATRYAGGVECIALLYACYGLGSGLLGSSYYYENAASDHTNGAVSKGEAGPERFFDVVGRTDQLTTFLATVLSALHEPPLAHRMPRLATRKGEIQGHVEEFVNALAEMAANRTLLPMVPKGSDPPIEVDGILFDSVFNFAARSKDVYLSGTTNH